MTRRILVPVDGSRKSTEGLEHALTTYGDASITVLHVVDTHRLAGGVGAGEDDSVDAGEGGSVDADEGGSVDPGEGGSVDADEGDSVDADEAADTEDEGSDGRAADLPRELSGDRFDEAREEADEVLAEAEALAADHGVSVETALEVGEPWRTIVAYAEANDIDHVVMGSHGRTEDSPVPLGSVAQAVMRRSPVHVSIVR